MSYVVYSKSGCVWCDRMKDLLKKRNITFTEVRIDANLENLEELKTKLPNVKTVPQLFNGDQHIGGFTEAQMYFNDIYGSDFGDNL